MSFTSFSWPSSVVCRTNSWSCRSQIETFASKPAAARRVPQNDQATDRIDRVCPSVMVLLQTQFFSPEQTQHGILLISPKLMITFTAPKSDYLVNTTWRKSKHRTNQSPGDETSRESHTLCPQDSRRRTKCDHPTLPMFAIQSIQRAFLSTRLRAKRQQLFINYPIGKVKSHAQTQMAKLSFRRIDLISTKHLPEIRRSYNWRRRRRRKRKTTTRRLNTSE